MKRSHRINLEWWGSQVPSHGGSAEEIVFITFFSMAILLSFVFIFW